MFEDFNRQSHVLGHSDKELERLNAQGRVIDPISAISSARQGSPGVCSANMGCIQHLQSGTAAPVRHWIEVGDHALVA